MSRVPTVLKAGDQVFWAEEFFSPDGQLTKVISSATLVLYGESQCQVIDIKLHSLECEGGFRGVITVKTGVQYVDTKLLKSVKESWYQG